MICCKKQRRNPVEGAVVYLFIIIFLVIALNLFFVLRRIRSNDKRRRKGWLPPDEAKQAIWRDKEVARRIEREQDDAIEIIKLKNETLALYEEVRRRHANDDKVEETITKTQQDPSVEDNEERIGWGSYYSKANDDKIEIEDFDFFRNDI